MSVTFEVVKVDGKVVPDFYAPGRTRVRAGAHTVALYKNANDATPFRTVTVTVTPSESAMISKSMGPAN